MTENSNNIFDELLLKLTNSTQIFDEALKPAIKTACKALRIATIKLNIYKNEENELQKNGESFVLYDEGSANENTKINKKHKAKNGAIAVLDIYPFLEAKAWDDLELDKIQIFAMILFTFGEHNKIINESQIADEKSKKIEELFPQAIKNEEFKVFYQPKVLLKNYKLNGAEALCRWFHDEKIVPPNDFIPVLESSKLICELDFYMLEHVCKDIRAWLDAGKKMVKISVNLSRQNIHTPDLLGKLLAIIDKYNVPHEFIEIELVETGSELCDEDLLDLVGGLRRAKISTAVDDFGTGFSSLALIRNIPWNVIKLDRSLLPSNADENSEQYKMVRHLLNMLRDMGFKCIFEGAETIEQVKMLKDYNCEEAQGYFFDKPLKKDEFQTRLEAL